jgi:hypothetical protein
LPQGPEVALAIPAIPIRILQSVIDGICGVPVKFGSAHSKALGGFQHPFSSLAGGGSIRDTHKFKNSMELKQSQWL